MNKYLSYKYYLIIISDKIKKFITDFYADSDEGKVFTYAEQLVKSNYTGCYGDIINCILIT